MPNPSELQRMVDERNEQFKTFQDSRNSVYAESRLSKINQELRSYITKSAKKELLAEKRKLESYLGREHEPYNRSL